MNKKKSVLIADVQALIAGIDKHFAAKTKVTIAGETKTAAEFTSELQTLVTIMTDVSTAEAAYKAKLAIQDAQAPAIIALASAVTAYARATYGNTQDVLVDFGLMPTKTRTTPTAAQKAIAVDKRAATRKARNTMGSRARLKVKGTLAPLTEAPDPSAAVTPSVVPASK